MRLHAAAELGQHQPAALAMEQRVAEPVFELLDGGRERRLRHMAKLGRPREAQGLRGGEEIPDLVHLHATPPAGERIIARARPNGAYESINEDAFRRVRGRARLREHPEEDAMPVYMVERALKGIAMEDLAAAQRAAIRTAEELSAKGTPMRYIRSTFAPEDGRCMCLFEAESADAVRRLNDAAKLPYTRVVPALDLTP